MTSGRTLILGTETRIALSIARSLGRHGVTADVMPARAGARAPRSRWIGKTFHAQGGTEAGQDMDEMVVRLAGEGRHDHLMATSDSGLRLVHRCHGSLPARIRQSVPGPDVIASVLDKAETNRLARAAGLPTPASWTLPDAAALSQREAELRFPLVAKPADKRVSEPFKVRYFEDREALRASFESDPAFGHNLLFQEFAAGEGVGVEVLMHDGSAICAFQHRRLRELPWAGGISVIAESEAVDPDLLDEAVRLLRTLGVEGLCMVEYRRDRDTGRRVFMEVNARAYGSLSLSERCGVELPWYHWQLLHGQRPQPPATYPPARRWRWSAGVMLRLDALGQPGPPWQPRPSVVRESLGAIRDLSPLTRDAVFSWSDPGPALGETARTARQLARRRARGLLRRLLPAPLFRRIQNHRHRSPRVRSWLRRRRAMRLLGLRHPRRRLSPGGIANILFICHGNIFRSPLCEYLLRRELEQRGDSVRTVASAGLHARDGNEAHAMGVEAAADLHIDLQPHRARAVTADMVAAADLVVVMDFINEAELLARHPSAAHKVIVIGDLAPGRGGVAVADPYGGDMKAVHACYADLAHRIAALRDWLLREPVAACDAAGATRLNSPAPGNAHRR